MVLDHVADGARLIVIAGSTFDTKRFARGDLHVVDVTRIPQLLEDRIRKAHHHDVLRGLLAEVVIDPKGVLLRKRLFDHFVEPLSAGQVGSEGLLDDHTRPTALPRLVESALAQIFQNDRELIRSGREIIEAISTSSALRIQFVETFGKGLIAFQGVELASVIKDRRGENRPQVIADLLA